MRTLFVVGALAAGALTACSAGPRDAMDVATSQLEQRVAAVSQALPLDTTGRYHQAVGRDPGLLGASVVYDKRAKCASDDAASCGAVLEEWPSARAAQQRAATLKGQGARAISVGRMVVELSPQLDGRAQQQYETALRAG